MKQKEKKLKKMDQVVDEIRGRFGYQSIQRAFMYQDKILAQLNSKRNTRFIHRHISWIGESRCFVMTAKVYVDVLAVFSGKEN